MDAWLGAAAAVAACALAPSLGAQRVWRGNLYPYLYYSSADGVWGAAHYGLTSPLGFAEQPQPNTAAFALDVGASTQGSYSLIVDAQAPAYWNGWRLGLTLTAARDNRLGFYGLGNDTPFASDSVTASAPYFYKVSRTHAGGRLTMQRRVLGPLRLFAGATIERTDFRALPGGSVFRRDLATGAVDSTAIPFTDRSVHAGIVLDTRDNELAPHAGLLPSSRWSRASGRSSPLAAITRCAATTTPASWGRTSCWAGWKRATRCCGRRPCWR